MENIYGYDEQFSKRMAQFHSETEKKSRFPRCAPRTGWRLRFRGNRIRPSASTGKPGLGFDLYLAKSTLMLRMRYVMSSALEFMPIRSWRIRSGSS